MQQQDAVGDGGALSGCEPAKDETALGFELLIFLGLGSLDFDFWLNSSGVFRTKPPKK